MPSVKEKYSLEKVNYIIEGTFVLEILYLQLYPSTILPVNRWIHIKKKVEKQCDYRLVT